MPGSASLERRRESMGASMLQKPGVLGAVARFWQVSRCSVQGIHGD